MAIKITDLPAGPYRDILAEVDRRGCELMGPMAIRPESVFIVGLCDIIAEMRGLKSAVGKQKAPEESPGLVSPSRDASQSSR